MLKSLEQLLKRLSTADDTEALSEQDLSLATAALLVDVATIDQDLDETEWQTLQSLLMTQCQLSAKEALAMAEAGKRKSADSSSLYEFTQQINRHCDHDQKRQLVEGLWQVAYADGRLDKYEEHIIRRIADLIHVSHHDFIQCKIKVRDS